MKENEIGREEREEREERKGRLGSRRRRGFGGSCSLTRSSGSV